MSALSRRAAWCAVLALAAGRASTQEQAGEPGREERLARLAERLEQEREALHVAGMSVAVVMGDEVVLARGFGRRDVEADLPATATTRYALGSTTKAFTAMLVAMLADDGRMSFEDPLEKHLPGVTVHDASIVAPITLCDALSHRTGLTRNDLLWYGTGATRATILARLPHAKAWAPYNTRFLYNNNLYLAAGEAAAAAAGKDWDTLLAERIFAPLRMEHAVTRHADALADPEFSRGYAWDAPAGAHTVLPPRNIDNVAPAGAIVASVDEVANWLRFLLGHGTFEGCRLVSDAGLERLWTRENTVTGSMGYGLGWFLREWRGRRLVEHGGNIDGFSAEIALLPDDGVGYVLLTNANGSPLQQASVELVFRELLGPREEGTASVARGGFDPARVVPGLPKPVAELVPYEGRYFVPPLQAWATVAIVGGQLTIDVPGQTRYVLEWPDAEGHWRFALAPEIVVKFAEPRGNWVADATLYQGGAEIKLARERTEPELPITLEELMELRAERLGAGRAADLGPVRLTGRFELPHSGLEGRATCLLDGPERMRLEYDLGEFGWFRYVVDGEVARTDSRALGAKVLDGAAADALAFQNPLVLAGDWLERCDEAVVERTDKVGGRPAVVVTLRSFAGGSYTLFADPDDGRVVQTAGLGAVLPLTDGLPVRYDDWREVESVRLPFRLWTEAETFGRMAVQFETAEVDVALDPATFEFGE